MFQELRILDGLIQNATATYDGESFTYNDVCARWQGDCFENDILNLDYVMDDVSIIFVESLSTAHLLSHNCWNRILNAIVFSPTFLCRFMLAL